MTLDGWPDYVECQYCGDEGFIEDDCTCGDDCCCCPDPDLEIRRCVCNPAVPEIVLIPKETP